MTPNLIEFLKVSTIVIAFSGLILFMRHYMLSIDDSRPEETLEEYSSEEAPIIETRRA